MTIQVKAIELYFHVVLFNMLYKMALAFHSVDETLVCDNSSRSICQNSNMASRLSGQTSMFGVVFFVSKSLLGIKGQRKLEKFAILTRKPRSHARILIYRTWPIQMKAIEQYLHVVLFRKTLNLTAHQERECCLFHRV